MATITSLVDRVRLELGDQSYTFVETVYGDGTTKRFSLDNFPLDASSITVKVNGTLVASNTVSVEERRGTLVLSTAPANNAVIEVSGTRFRYFSTADLQQLVEAAVSQHLHNRTDSFGRRLTVENLPTVEEYPTALLASVQALYALATDAAFDIDISAPDGVMIPRSERYRQLNDMIAVRREQYQMLCEALNIGLYKIEVYTLRRVAKNTNHYVPIYQPQEIDDYSQPRRVYLPIPTYGDTGIPDASGHYDIVLTQGDNFTALLDFPFDLTGYTALAQVRTFAESPIIAATFSCSVEDALAGKLSVSLTPDQTMNLPLRSVWDIQLTKDNTGENKTYMSGSVFCARQVSRGQATVVHWGVAT